MTDSKEGVLPEVTDIQTMSEDIADFIDENPINSLSDVTEVNDAVSRLENLRTTFRHLNLQSLANSGNSLPEEYVNQMETIKQYIKDAKERRRDIIGANTEASSYVRKKTVSFSIKTLEQNLSALESKIHMDITEVTDAELTDINKSDQNKTIERTAHQIKDLIKEAAGTTQEPEVDRVQLRYERIRRLTNTYQSKIKAELSTRDVTKHATFKELLLKIRLSKFSGFTSKSDIYTFQNDFEKLHLRSTPKCYLPDLLCNNYLEDPALSMVKGENDIDEIWKRLQSSSSRFCSITNFPNFLILIMCGSQRTRPKLQKHWARQ